MVVSAQIGRQVSDPTTLSFSGVPGTNLVAPDEAMLFSGVARLKTRVHFAADTAALSAADLVELGQRLTFDGAVRLDRFAADYRNATPAPVAFQHTDIAASYRAALTYALTPATHAYVMWGTSFDPSAEGLSLSASTADLAPERNQTVETGLKWSPRATLLLSAALFRTIQFNSREPSPTDPTLTVLAGTARSQGVELLAQGRVTARWMVQGGYAYPRRQDRRLAQRRPRPPAAERAQAQSAAIHRLRPDARPHGGRRPRLSVGTGPKFEPDPNGFSQSVPGYATLSVLARYRLSAHASLQLNVDNLANARYYDGLDDNHVNVRRVLGARDVAG